MSRLYAQMKDTTYRLNFPKLVLRIDQDEYAFDRAFALIDDIGAIRPNSESK